MAIKVRVGDNVVIEADGEADLKAVLAALGHATSAANGKPGSDVANKPLPERLRYLRDVAGRPQQELFTRLHASAEWVSDEDLAVLLMTDRSKLGGIMMSLSKQAKRLGLDVERHVLARRIERSAEGRRQYFYRLTPDMRDAMDA